MPRAITRRMGGLVAMLPGILIIAATLPPPVLATAADWQIREDTTLTETFHGTIEITRDGVTLDCASNHVIGEGHGRGIVVDSRSDVTVRNCDVSNFAIGIRVSGSTGITIVDNVAHDNGWSGFFVQSVKASEFSDNAALDNNDGYTIRHSSGNHFARNIATRSVAGFWISDGSSSNQFDENTASYSAYGGFVVVEASGNTLAGNLADHNSDRGYILTAASGNHLEGNTSRQNEIGGFLVNQDSDGNTLAGNVAVDNLDGGFVVADRSDANTLTENEASRNDFGFAVVTGSTGNSLSANTACGNRALDAYQDTTATDNGWVDNVFGTTYGIPPQDPCSNDWFESAIEVSALPFSATVDVGSATNQPGEDTGCLWNTPGAVWYKGTPSTDITVMASVTGDGGGQTVLNVFYATGPQITDLVRTYCIAWETPTPLPLDLTAATTYYFQVAQQYPAGTVTFALEAAP